MLQLEPLIPPTDLWPGGIPACLRVEPSSVEWSDMVETSKGWLQFVQEEWTESESLDEELQQRRRLMERWASASQDFRDSYQNRASLPESAVQYPMPLLKRVRHAPKQFFCLAPVDRESHATNYTRLVKLLILLYTSLRRGGKSHPMSFEPDPYPQIPAVFPDHTRSSPAPEALIPQYCLESADFRYISMTHTGTVLFPRFNDTIFTVIDQESLNTGQLIMLELHVNGQIKDYTRLRPWHAGEIMMYHNVQGWPLAEMIDWSMRARFLPRNNPLDLDQPLVDIIDSAQQKRELDIHGFTRELLTAQIEVFAPGYLELERQGLEVQYDLANLMTGDDIRAYNYMIPPGDPARRQAPSGQ
ncbi:uncharacterized protein BO88DRAFT_486395 [Aspergillus vadensis CBS 113365]|uniref:Uncharacterized protein n=1 Tax=Aspergillus vadensis (strain CBS 113365 / IMI 142717 / IBT 24658) TaxID=1448311 RepID=A0A319BJD8_ASPVC|nr:hypothetical protein BO88DRAFT_486395 [Aspergillus vadensis CBS 113365]PYH71040.1 hypothetical protein BO88DRAFT_486395 [Aspergillus vadensis CBS 113365]